MLADADTLCQYYSNAFWVPYFCGVVLRYCGRALGKRLPAGAAEKTLEGGGAAWGTGTAKHYQVVF